MRERAPRHEIARERRPTPHDRLLHELAKIEDLPTTLKRSLKDAEEGNVPRNSKEDNHESPLDVQKVVEALISDSELKRALVHLLTVEEHRHVQEVSLLKDAPYLFQLWSNILHQMGDAHGRAQHDIDQDLFLFNREWNALPVQDQKHLRMQLLEQLRHTFFSAREQED